jgi:hypothetical protein
VQPVIRENTADSDAAAQQQTASQLDVDFNITFQPDQVHFGTG